MPTPTMQGARGDQAIAASGADGPLGLTRTLALIVVPLGVVYATLLLTAGVVAGRVPLPLEAMLVNMTAAAMAVMVVIGGHRWFGAQRSLSSYGLTLDHQWWKDLLAGLLIGFGGVSVPFLVGLLGGWLQIGDVLAPGVMPLGTGIALIVVANLCVGVWEELMLRGVFLRTAADGLARWLSPRGALIGGIAVSATVFGLAHAAQPAEPSFLLTWVLAGVVFAVVAVRSGSLALPIGAHAAFNVAYQAVFVRTDLDGIAAVSALLRIDVDPGIWVLGFGGLLEASAFLCLGLVALAYLRLRRPPARR